MVYNRSHSLCLNYPEIRSVVVVASKSITKHAPLIRSTPRALNSSISTKYTFQSSFQPFRPSCLSKNVLLSCLPWLTRDTFVGFMPWSGDSVTEAVSDGFNVSKHRISHVVGRIEIETICRTVVRVFGFVFSSQLNYVVSWHKAEVGDSPQLMLCWLSFSVCLPSPSGHQSWDLGTQAWAFYVQASPSGTQASPYASQVSSSEFTFGPLQLKLRSLYLKPGPLQFKPRPSAHAWFCTTQDRPSKTHAWFSTTQV